MSAGVWPDFTGRGGWWRAALCAAVLACQAPGGTRAAPPSPAPPPPASVSSQEEVDARIVTAAEAAVISGRAPALAAHITALEAVQARTPRGYRMLERTPREIRYRATDAATQAAFIAWLKQQPDAAGKALPVVFLPNTYGRATWLIAWYQVDTGQPEKAIATIDRVPDLLVGNADLVAEKGAALNHLRRFQDAVAVYDTALSEAGFLPDRLRALLLRGKGFGLIELRRYDEAERCYHDALVLEPDHQGARNELAYIAKLRAGGPTAPSGLNTYDKAKQGIPPKTAP